jgi:hypothetical protein
LSHLEADGRDISAVTAELSGACAAVDVLDPYVRDELLGDICNKEMTAYTQIFSSSGEVSHPSPVNHILAHPQ